jgi:putative hydrolase of the HAD superfamily
MTQPNFSDIRHWIFDLDNTLYPRRCDLFAQIDVKMTQFVSEFLDLPHAEARLKQKQYYRDHGTTLQGLMVNHGMKPQKFLDAVHDIDYSPVSESKELRAALDALPGQKLIFTNGDVPHAERTTKALGIDGCFDGIFDIVAADFLPKPAAKPYEQFISMFDVNPSKAAMFEDLPRNLAVPKQMGMRTVLVVDDAYDTSAAEAWETDGRDDGHIDHISNDIAQFLHASLK